MVIARASLAPAEHHRRLVLAALLGLLAGLVAVPAGLAAPIPTGSGGASPSAPPSHASSSQGNAGQAIHRAHHYFDSLPKVPDWAMRNYLKRNEFTPRLDWWETISKEQQQHAPHELREHRQKVQPPGGWPRANAPARDETHKAWEKLMPEVIDELGPGTYGGDGGPSPWLVRARRDYYRQAHQDIQERRARGHGAYGEGNAEWEKHIDGLMGRVGEDGSLKRRVPGHPELSAETPEAREVWALHADHAMHHTQAATDAVARMAQAERMRERDGDHHDIAADSAKHDFAVHHMLADVHADVARNVPLYHHGASGADDRLTEPPPWPAGTLFDVRRGAINAAKLDRLDVLKANSDATASTKRRLP